MKKITTVNLNNFVFNIDEDAFELLQTYLFEIEGYLVSNENKQKIIGNLEAKIAAYFSSNLSKKNQSINLQIVQELVKILGKPSQFADESFHASETVPPSPQNKVKRFYRDPENGWLGGVAAGMAIYFSWDVTLIRLAMCVLLIFGMGSIVPVYLVIWLVVPAAVTEFQKMEMQGEELTVEMLKQELGRLKLHWASNRFKQSTTDMGNRLLVILHAFLKGLFWFVGIISGLLVAILLLTIVALLLIAIFNPTLLSEFAPGIFSSQSTLGSMPNLITIIFALILVIGCPIFMLLFLSVRSISGRYKYSRFASWTVFFIWISSLALLYTISFSGFLSNKQHPVPFKVHWSSDKNKMVDEIRLVESFDAVEVYGNIELVLMNGPIQSLIVSSQPDYMSHITTNVEEGVLHIYTDGLSLTRDVKIIVSSNKITSVLAKGACLVKTVSQFKVPMFSLQLIGASRADMNMNVEGLFSVNVKGASQAFFKGASQTLKFKAVGASKIRASDLKAQFVNVAAVGVSTVSVYAVQSLNADAVGASDIECKGNPKSREIRSQLGSSVVLK
jgi:phage shock protein PspC (stress-responsive transcriptional regulator)